MPIHPLTHCNRAGLVLRRELLVEAQIERALALEPARVIDRARLTDRQRTDYLQEEALVYLIREYHRRGDRSTVNALAEALLKRCAKVINGRLQALGPRIVDQAFADVVAELFDPILDLTSDRGDYLQVRFWVAAERRAISVFNRYVRQLKNERQTVPLSSVAGYDADFEGDEGRRVTLSHDVLAAVITTERLVLLQDGLRALSEPYRTAFILRHYEGWPTYDRDPAVPTISRYFNKEPRTIRNWLAKAEQELERWRGEQQ